MPLLAAASLAACSTLTPQIFSERLAPPPGDTVQRASQPEALKSGLNGMVDIEDALAEAQRVQRQYVSAVKGLSEVGTGTSAALIGLSALALFKGVTNPTSADLAGLGILGSTTYVYGSTMTSKPRQLLFLAGAEALNCAVASTRPYAMPAGFLRPVAVASASAGPSTADDSLQGLVAQAATVSADLDRKVQALQPYAQNRIAKEPVGKTPPAGCRPAQDNVCPAADPKDNADRQRQAADCQARAARRKAECSGPVTKERVYTPHPDVAVALRLLKAQRRHLASLTKTASQQAAVFDAAGNALWEHTIAVQLKVAAEVLRTEPDLTAVLTATQGMRGTAFSISRAPSLAASASEAGASAAGKAESGGAGAARGADTRLPSVEQERPEQELADAAQTLAAAVRLADRLQARLTAMQERVRSAQRQLDRCGRGGANVRLVISPDVSEIELAPGGSHSFNVRGGTDSPIGEVQPGNNPKPGVLARNLDGSFTYMADPKAADGSSVTLHFTDGGRLLVRDILVKIEQDDAAGPAADISTFKLAALAAALNLTDNPPNDKAVMQRIEACQKNVLKRATADGHTIDSETLTAVMTGKCHG